MLKRGGYLMIQHKHDDGVYIKDIAGELGVHPKTVSRALSILVENSPKVPVENSPPADKISNG